MKDSRKAMLFLKKNNIAILATYGANAEIERSRVLLIVPTWGGPVKDHAPFCLPQKF